MSAKAFRPAALALLFLAVVLVLAVVGIVWHRPDLELSASVQNCRADAGHGAYLALLGDCAACHTSPGGRPFAGGLALASPLGAVYATNITPDRETGIGAYTFDDFVRVMRFGIAPGRHLYPAMPYTAFAKVSDDDLQDLFAFLNDKVEAVRQPNRASDIPWPLSMRWPLALWNLAFHDDRRFRPDASQGAQINRGAYLVQGLAHCGTCHTSRGLAFEEKDVSGRSQAFLAGASLDGSSPINLRGDPATGLGAWSHGDLVELLKTGRTARSAVTGPMTEVVAKSTQFMSDGDLGAIAAYVKSLSPSTSPHQATFQPSDATMAGIMSGRRNDVGARSFMDSCAACHRLDGQGYDHTFPRLAGNATVLADNTDSLIAILLQGNRLPSTAPAPSGLAMPPFGWRYDDQEMAALATFVRTSWGNQASAVSADQVRRIREQLHIADTRQ